MASYRSPRDRLGVYKRLEEVPSGRRFHQFASGYAGKDTWAGYRATVELSDHMSEEWGRFVRRWKNHMDDRGRHHALARPDDVESWSVSLLEQFSTDRAYQHWNVIEGFYSWLMHHTEHPHTYNPFHMAAAADGSSARKIWNRKMEKANE